MTIGWMATGLALAAMPAIARIWDGGRSAVDTPRPRIVTAPADGTRDIRESIRNGRQAGQLDRREARSLCRQARGVSSLTDRYARDGLSHSETQEIAVRTEALRGEVGARRLRGD